RRARPPRRSLERRHTAAFVEGLRGTDGRVAPLYPRGREGISATGQRGVPGAGGQVLKKCPPPGRHRSRDTRNFHDCTSVPGGGRLSMVYRHRGHNRGGGPFLSSFSGGQNSSSEITGAVP